MTDVSCKCGCRVTVSAYRYDPEKCPACGEDVRHPFPRPLPPIRDGMFWWLLVFSACVTALQVARSLGWIR